MTEQTQIKMKRKKLCTQTNNNLLAAKNWIKMIDACDKPKKKSEQSGGRENPIISIWLTWGNRVNERSCTLQHASIVGYWAFGARLWWPYVAENQHSTDLVHGNVQRMLQKISIFNDGFENWEFSFAKQTEFSSWNFQFGSFMH